MASFSPYLEQEGEFARLERAARIRVLSDMEADRYAELMFAAQNRGLRLYNRRVGSNAFAKRWERTA